MSQDLSGRPDRLLQRNAAHAGFTQGAIHRGSAAETVLACIEEMGAVAADCLTGLVGKAALSALSHGAAHPAPFNKGHIIGNINGILTDILTSSLEMGTVPSHGTAMRKYACAACRITGSVGSAVLVARAHGLFGYGFTTVIVTGEHGGHQDQ